MRSFVKSDCGQDLIEYTLLLAFIALVSAAIFQGVHVDWSASLHGPTARAIAVGGGASAAILFLWLTLARRSDRRAQDESDQSILGIGETVGEEGRAAIISEVDSHDNRNHDGGIFQRRKESPEHEIARDEERRAEKSNGGLALFRASLRHHVSIAEVAESNGVFQILQNSGIRLSVLVRDSITVDPHTNSYTLGRNDITEIVDIHPRGSLQFIVTLSSYKQYTTAAKEAAEQCGIRLMSAVEFLDAISRG
jgi:Flp pilus assembly pilin Flp